MSKTFYIFRHGETRFSKTDTPYGDQALVEPILPEAKAVIEKLATYLKDIQTDTNLRSDIHRCQQTTQIVTQISGKVFDVDARLTEYYQESFEELRSRVENFIADINKSDYQSVAVCTHGAVISALRHLLLTGDYDISDLHDYPQPGVLLIIKDGQAEEVSFRD